MSRTIRENPQTNKHLFFNYLFHLSEANIASLLWTNLLIDKERFADDLIYGNECTSYIFQSESCRRVKRPGTWDSNKSEAVRKPE